MSREDGKWWRDSHGVYNTRWWANFTDDLKSIKLVFHSNRDFMKVGCPIVVAGRGLFRVTDVQGKHIKLQLDTPKSFTAYPSASIEKE